MSSSSSKAIAIPKRKQKRPMSGSLGTPSTPTSSSSTASPSLNGFAFSSYASTSSTSSAFSPPSSSPQPANTMIERKDKGKHKERELRRRESLMCMSPTLSQVTVREQLGGERQLEWGLTRDNSTEFLHRRIHSHKRRRGRSAAVDIVCEEVSGVGLESR